MFQQQTEENVVIFRTKELSQDLLSQFPEQNTNINEY